MKREPQNALAWARLAELHASFGNLDKSLEAAQKAVALAAQSLPDTDRSRLRLPDAGQDEGGARGLREGDRAGSGRCPAEARAGLAKIRDGKLDAGSREIEVAASLDASNALVRSYLGKAYYEEKRSPLDEREYSVAKQLDPKDPTPWFYDAIAKQTTNRPVEALQDLEKAIELNDNRAVYRSRLLLDSDVAARSASQARIYTRSGLPAAGPGRRLEIGQHRPTQLLRSPLSGRLLLRPAPPRDRPGQRAAAVPAASAHQHHADPAAARREQPVLDQRRRSRALSFNEFNPIFNRDGVTGQVSGLVGENDTWAAKPSSPASTARSPSASVTATSRPTGSGRTPTRETTSSTSSSRSSSRPRPACRPSTGIGTTEHGDLQQRFFEDRLLPRPAERAGAAHRPARCPARVLAELDPPRLVTYQDADGMDATTSRSPSSGSFIEVEAPAERLQRRAPAPVPLAVFQPDDRRRVLRHRWRGSTDGHRARFAASLHRRDGARPRSRALQRLRVRERRTS